MNESLSLTLNSRVVRLAGQVFGEVDGQVVLLAVESGEYRAANPTGSRVWGMLEKPWVVSALVAALVEEFEVTPEQCEREMLAFLEKMRVDGLIEVAAD